jgi:hypothetical protein
MLVLAPGMLAAFATAAAAGSLVTGEQSAGEP